MVTQPFSGSKNTLVVHPTTDEISFGFIHESTNRGEVIEAGPIILKVGRHTGPNRGFGINHIWLEHKNDLIKVGYLTPEDAIQFVADIIVEGAAIHCEFSSLRGNHRTTVLKSALGLVVLEPKETGSGEIQHSVVTAYPNGKARGTLIGTIKKVPK